MDTNKNTQKCMNEFLTLFLKNRFIKKPNVENLMLDIKIEECDCNNYKHFVVNVNIRYLFFGPETDINTEKIENHVDNRLSNFTKEELESAKKEVNIKELVNSIYD